MEKQEKNIEFKPFKFRELKIYSSTEWLADNKKKYRQVFDRYETTYIYAELSFYNKMFDRDIWDVNIELKCYSLNRGKREICSLNFKRKVSKYDSVVFIREGWGNKKEGVFWKKGTYFWEAWVEGEKVATKYFYVEDAGRNIKRNDNPYIDIQSIRLYEGQYDDVAEDDRTYFRTFSCEETGYIYAEIVLKNKHNLSDWQCELFTKFYNEAKELKGQVIRLHSVKATDELIKISAGWGSNVKGSWRKGHYTVELVFMDNLLAVMPFEVAEEFLEGTSAVQLPNSHNPVLLTPEADPDLSFEDVFAKLNSLVGLSDIKQQVRDHADYLQFVKLRKEKGFKEKDQVNVHSVFIGNPGTGKTTVATMMGMLYKKMGLLTKGHVHEVDRVDLVGEYIGQTAPKVKEAIDKARGGVLFIDEAYALARANDDSKDFGREVIEILVKEMSNGAGDLVVIVAGYPKEMKHFMDSNPGLKSRFKLYYEFKDYLPQELSRIADYAALEKEVELVEEAKVKVDEIITEAFRNRDKAFGNARFVHDLIDKAKINLGLRIMKSANPELRSDDDLSLILLDDIQKINLQKENLPPMIPVDEKLLGIALAELNELIGLQNIKTQINELVELVRFYRETGKNVLNKFFLHTVFIGNPGTGKTTVARILCKIYKALGILERGHMVETDRQGLVAGYIGQTALKTTEKIDESMGGVLFIDEAYALTSNSSSGADYGNEVIQTILKRMEDNRGRFFVFVAGYPDNMESFLKANPGLSSRFDKTLKFEDYNPTELSSIASFMIKDNGLKINKKAEDHLFKYLNFIYDLRDKYFGNARTVRSIILDVIKRQNLRLAALDAEKRKKSMINLITFEDVKHLTQDKDQLVFTKKTIGFKK